MRTFSIFRHGLGGHLKSVPEAINIPLVNVDLERKTVGFWVRKSVLGRSGKDMIAKHLLPIPTDHQIVRNVGMMAIHKLDLNSLTADDEFSYHSCQDADCIPHRIPNE
jgi:hypothetical protein